MLLFGVDPTSLSNIITPLFLSEADSTCPSTSSTSYRNYGLDQIIVNHKDKTALDLRYQKLTDQDIATSVYYLLMYTNVS